MPDARHAAKVLQSMTDATHKHESNHWELLARGRFLPYRRLQPDARQEIHRQLGIDRLHIRHR